MSQCERAGRLIDTQQASEAVNLLCETNREEAALAANPVQLGMTLRYWIGELDRDEYTERKTNAVSWHDQGKTTIGSAAIDVLHEITVTETQERMKEVLDRKRMKR